MKCLIVRPLIPDHFSQILFKLVWLNCTLTLGILEILLEDILEESLN